MNEEKLTKYILKWLFENDWDIISFDFPQSGTGVMLHSNLMRNNKNKKGIIPDIIAIKEGICLFFENKDRFYYLDFVKQNELIKGDEYEGSINRVLKNHKVDNIYYGIGLPVSVEISKLNHNKNLVDFIVTVDWLNYKVEFFHDKYSIRRLFD